MNETEPANAVRIGEVLGDKYRLIALIGQGGMGAVYEAQHTVVGRRFAVKVLHAELARRPDLLARFLREAQSAGSLDSENIASVVDFGHAREGLPYMVMELLGGEDLGRILAREGRLPVARAVDIVIQACRGLDAAHAVGIIHRDLKPENLFVSRRGDDQELIKILDFGIAKLGTAGRDGDSPSITRTGSTMGTPLYMSPEQARGDKELDHRADIYALGVILFEALSGARPHDGDSYNAVVYHILMRPPAVLAEHRAGLPPGLTEVVHQALAARPEDRQSSAAELARQLARFAGREVAPVRSHFELRAAGAGGARPAALATAPSQAPPHRARGLRLALAGVLVSTVAAGAFLFLARRRPPEATGLRPSVPAVAAAPASAPEKTTPARPPIAEPAPRPPVFAPPPPVFAPPPPLFAPPPPVSAVRPPRSPPRRARREAKAAEPAPQPSPLAEPVGPRRPAFDRSDPYQ